MVASSLHSDEYCSYSIVVGVVARQILVSLNYSVRAGMLPDT